jgi:hypothetical protein
MAGRVACGERACSFTFTAPHCGGEEPINTTQLQLEVAEKAEMVDQSETKNWTVWKDGTAMPSGRRPSAEDAKHGFQGLDVSPADHAKATLNHSGASAPHVPVPDIICATCAAGIAACQLSVHPERLSEMFPRYLHSYSQFDIRPD